MAAATTGQKNEGIRTLNDFADSLKASTDYYKEGMRLCEDIRQYLEKSVKHSKPGFTIASTYYGGSVGKKTDVKSPDFDMVMKINKKTPPFVDVLDFFWTRLTGNTFIFRIDKESLKLTRYSIQFTFTNGIEVDLLPAMAKLTPQEIFVELKQLPYSQRRYYYSALVESHVSFMRQQDALAHRIARLAKYWRKSMTNIKEYINGGSFIFELLAVAAWEKEKEERPNGPLSNVTVFRRVVDLVSLLDQTALYFEWVDQPCKGGEFQRLIQRYRQRGDPFLLDPANPLNNLLHGMKPEVMNKLMENARIMQSRLNELTDKESDNVDFEKLLRQ